jgi:hypothetical protein
MAETPRICRTCRHLREFWKLSPRGELVRECEFSEQPDAEGRCLSVWPRMVEDETPITDAKEAQS